MVCLRTFTITFTIYFLSSDDGQCKSSTSPEEPTSNMSGFRRNESDHSDSLCGHVPEETRPDKQGPAGQSVVSGSQLQIDEEEADEIHLSKSNKDSDWNDANSWLTYSLLDSVSCRNATDGEWV